MTDGVEEVVAKGPYRPAEERRSPFVPMLVLGLSFAGWAGFQTVMLAREAEALKAAKAGQEGPVAQAGRLRGALDAVARETQKLADGGNANARLIVDELRRRGVTINPNAAPAGARESKQ